MAEGSAAVSTNASERFFRHFQLVVNDLQSQIEKIEKHSPGTEHADAVEHSLSGIARLSSEVNDASSYLPAYDQRTYSDAIKALNSKLQQARSYAAPRPRFSFKSKPLFTAIKNESAISILDAAELAKQKRPQVPGYRPDTSNDSSFVNSPIGPPSPANEGAVPEGDQAEKSEITAMSELTRHPSFSQSTSVNIANHSSVHIMLPRTAAHATSSGTLAHLQHSVIDMSIPAHTGNAFAGLTLKDISQSLIICGHVDGAAHLTNIRDSVIVVASRQFRMHASSGCDVYLLTTSRPIIEDCSGIRFAPIPAIYMSGQDETLRNQWASVDDFNWLRQEPSPNWTILDQVEIIPETFWQEVVPGRPDIGVRDILGALRKLR